jgi:hypothetical protein
MKVNLKRPKVNVEHLKKSIARSGQLSDECEYFCPKRPELSAHSFIMCQWRFGKIEELREPLKPNHGSLSSSG